MLKRISLSLLFVLPVFALAYTNPGKPSGFVNDFAGMLSSATVSSLNTTLSQFEASTTNEIAIVTINNLGNDYIENYAAKLFQDWGIGKKGENNGLLILIAKEEREIKIEVGYGLEPYVTDLESAHIISEVMVPAFKNGDYNAGVTGGVARIMNDINVGAPQVKTEARKISSESIGNLVYFGIFILIYLGSILGRSKSWWAGGIIGAIAGIIIGGVLAVIGLALLGLLFDYIVSRAHQKYKDGGPKPPWFLGGGGFGGGGGGGFGGFGGGMSGGGGSSGRW